MRSAISAVALLLAANLGLLSASDRLGISNELAVQVCLLSVGSPQPDLRDSVHGCRKSREPPSECAPDGREAAKMPRDREAPVDRRKTREPSPEPHLSR